MRVHYVVNARMPHTRAYGIQIAKMCEAFIEAGFDLTLVIPRTYTSHIPLREHNQLRVEIPTVVLPGFDGYGAGRLAFIASSVLFMLTSFVYLLSERLRGRVDVIYTVDMDTFSYALLPLLGVPCFVEMHAAKKRNALNAFFFRRAAGVIATNHEIKNTLMKRFRIPEGRICVEPNGVDLDAYAHAPSKSDAREKLSLPQEAQLALYSGRFYTWKKLDILAAVSARMPDVQFYVVGGDRVLFERVTGLSTMPDNLHVAGECEPHEVPTWLVAADVLLLLGTRANERSYRETAPMKTYEYMAAGRPVVASRTPALESIIAPNEALFYAPDDADDLVRVVRGALKADASTGQMLSRARQAAERHSWESRVGRIQEFISSAS